MSVATTIKPNPTLTTTLNPSPKIHIPTWAVVLIIFVIISVCTWSSYIIFKNPYTYPTRFWLYFLLGLLAYIITLMIDNLSNLKLLETFQYVIITLTIVFNLFIIINTYTKYLNIPSNLVNTIVFMTGFIVLYTLNFLISSTYKVTKTTTTNKSNTPRKRPDDIFDGNYTPDVVNAFTSPKKTPTPTPKPTPTPTLKPTPTPTLKPTTKPTIKPTIKPTTKPTTKPTPKATVSFASAGKTVGKTVGKTAIQKRADYPEDTVNTYGEGQDEYDGNYPEDTVNTYDENQDESEEEESEEEESEEDEDENSEDDNDNDEQQERGDYPKNYAGNIEAEKQLYGY